MACDVLYDPMKGACFFDTVTDTCFGPLMEDDDEAEAFRTYLEDKPTFIRGRSSSDPRAYVDSLLRHHYDTFVAARREAEKADADSIDDTARKLLREFAKNGVAEMSEVTSK